jgi:hypothetical protein
MLLKTTFLRYGKFIYDNNPKVSINNDAVATVDNTKPSFDFELHFEKLQTSGNAAASI